MAVDLAERIPWPGDQAAARALQAEMAGRVSCRPEAVGTPRWVAGVDVSPADQDGWVSGAAVVLEWPGMGVAEVRVRRARPAIPYIPGLLGFREAPAAEAALEALRTIPDVILVDGQGMAHPRRFGLACHLGLVAGKPTVGCAKSRLVGSHQPLEGARGSWQPLVDAGQVVGAALRTREGTSPVYVSVGHMVDLPQAISVVLACCKGYRLPEPARQAHKAASGRLPEG